ncbi:hypothetical protein BH09MYX1_BH09MYX1_51280 [soil metagenome]
MGKPVASVSTVKLQTFTGPLAPDAAYADYSTGTNMGMRVFTHTFTDSTITVPPVAKLGATGTSLADATLDVDATGYDYADGALYDATAQNSPWVLYFTGPTLTAHKLPHLPSSVALSTITSSAELSLSVTVVKSTKKPKDYSDVGGYSADASASAFSTVTAAF